LLAICFLVGQQLVADSALTAYDITETSVRQAIVEDRQLGRVNATVRVASLLAQLVLTLGGGLLAVAIGLRAASFVAPIGGVLAVAFLWYSPMRRLRSLPSAAET